MPDHPSQSTPVPYSREQQAQIRERMMTPGSALLCPQCGKELHTQKVPGAGGGTVLGCDPCGRIMIAKDSPPAKKPPRRSLDKNGRIVYQEGEAPPLPNSSWQVQLLWLLAVLLTVVWMASPESSRVAVAVLAVLYALALLATRRWLRERKARARRRAGRSRSIPPR